MWRIALIIAQFALYSTTVFAANFQCERVFSSDLQVSQIKFCNSLTIDNLPERSKIGKNEFDNKLYYSVLADNNLGGIKVLFPGNQEKIVYRSSYLAGAPLCIQSLSQNGVRTVINLYSGNLGYAPYLYPLEKNIFQENNVRDYIQIQEYMVNALELAPEELNLKIVDIIKKIASAKENVLIHCYSGTYDTGVIFGILSKCYNKQSLDNIRQEALCHIGGSLGYQRTGFPRIMKIIEQFPCELLAQ